MKFFYLFFAALLMFNVNLNAQFVDNMEYPNGPPYGEWWMPAPIIANGVGSIPGDGTTNAILGLGNQTDGIWGIVFKMYVPSGKEAYFNLQEEIPNGNGEMPVTSFFFNQGLASSGIGSIENTALGNVYFDFPHDQWFEIYMSWTLGNANSNSGNTWYVAINVELVIPFNTPFTNSTGDLSNSIGGIEFFSISSDNEFYIDDFGFDVLQLNINNDNQIKYTIYPNPVQNILNIDIQKPLKSVLIYNLQGSVVKNTSQVKSIDVSNLNSGMYFIEVRTSSGKSMQRFIKR